MDVKNSGVEPIKDLRIGIEAITHWRRVDETHLPEGGPHTPYMPTYRPLHAVLHKPTLDERLLDLLQPAAIDSELMDPARLSDARIDVRTLLAQYMDRTSAGSKIILERALYLIDNDQLLDDEVRASLAALFRA